jgi:hypothetical protein
MDISIAHPVSSLSSRNDERQPRLRQLQFSSVDGVGRLVSLFRRGDSPRAKSVRDRLQCVARGNLRAAPLALIRADALYCRRASVRPRRLEAIEPRLIDGLERKLELEARLGRGVELPRRRDRAIAIQVRAVTLETQ